MRNYSSPLACFIAAASLLPVPSPQPQTTATRLKMPETRFWAAGMRRAPLLELHLGVIAKWPR